MVRRLVDFDFVVLKLLIVKIHGIIAISKMDFLKFAGKERVKQNQKKFKRNWRPPTLVSQSLSH